MWLRRFTTLHILGRKLDLVELVIAVAIEIFLYWAFTNITASVLGPLIKNEVVLGFVYVAVVFSVFFAPLCYFYGPPWGTKQPQRVLNIGGRSTPTAQSNEEIDAVSQPANQPLPAAQDVAQLQQQIITERANARRWEYVALRWILAIRSQLTLDWLYNLRNEPPLAISFFCSAMNTTEEERNAVIAFLTGHFLIEIQNGLVTITPKGIEYVEWRGPTQLPPQTQQGQQSDTPET